jgi:hypothetical protein
MMPEFSVNVTASGWFNVTADTLAEAEQIATALVRDGVPSGLEIDYVDIDSVEPDDA